MDKGVRFWISIAVTIVLAVAASTDMPLAWKGGLLAVAILCLLGGTWPYLTLWLPAWVPGGYRFPPEDKIEVHLEPEGEDEVPPYSVVLELPNPGRTDTWDVRAVDVQGTDRSVSPAWYGTWRGTDLQEKTVHKDDSAYLEVGTWSSMGEGWTPDREPGERWRPGQLTVSASTGSVPMFLNREGARSVGEVLSRRVRITFRLLSHDTGRTRRYQLSIGANPNQQTGEPEVVVEQMV